MDVLAKGLLVAGALVLFAATLTGLLVALRYMHESLGPFGKTAQIGACVAIVLFALAIPGTAVAGLSSGEAMLVIGLIALVTFGGLSARGARVRRRMQRSDTH